MSASSSEEDDIEMTNLEVIEVTPDPGAQNSSKHVPYEQDYDDDMEHGDDGDVALLGSPQRTRGRERILRHSLSGWYQVRGIVIEVCPHVVLLVQWYSS
jgi:solute carrier family 41